MNDLCDKTGVMPFWFWNGKQSEEEISRQMRLAKAGGVRGLTVHARKGNQIEYMSERWLELFRHTCLEARRLGLEIWLYDEEGCPSGTVGERLPSRGRNFQQKALTFAYMPAGQTVSAGGEFGFRSEAPSGVWQVGSGKGELVRAFLADDLSCPVDPAALPGETEVLVFNKVFITDYIDALNRETLEEFLDMTHRVYWQRLEEFFGDPVTAVYTDDLNHLLIYGENVPFLSYTESLEETFQAACGYSILDNLPSLVENLPGCEKVRIDYRRTVMQMFLDNFVEPMRQWCNEHNLPLTGHLSGDEGSMLQSICRFTSAMPFYECEDIPGIDDFLACRQDHAYMRHPVNELGFSGIILCKQASSVAGQFKKGRCSSEVLTSRGWGVPVSSQLAQIRFQQGLGINILIPHDFSYATAGVTKRDHPASYFFQQPWFELNREIYRGVNNSSRLLSRGVCAAKAALLHPVSSGWVALDGERLAEYFTCRFPAKYPDTAFLEKNLAEISLQLLRKHIDFDYVDETLMARSQISGSNGLTIGDKHYDVLLLPPMCNIQPTTLDVLAKANCRVVQLGEGPVLVDGVLCETPFDFPVIENPEDQDWRFASPLLDFRGSGEILLHTREVDGQLEYFLVNFSEEKQHVKIDSNLENYVLYDPGSDRIICDNGQFPDDFELQPAACCHIVPEHVVLNASRTDISATLYGDLEKNLEQVMLFQEVEVVAANDNNLLVDSGQLANGCSILFSESEDIPVGIEIFISIHIPDPEEITGIFAEKAELANMLVNGHKLVRHPEIHHPATPDLYWASLDGLLVTGENKIKITGGGKRIEMFYLSGRFAVALQDSETYGIIPRANQPLTTGDLSRQGLPFYWGKVKYMFEFELAVSDNTCQLDLGSVDGTVTVVVNGNSAGVGYRAPWLFDLAGMLHPGTNRIEIELFNTAQNFFGPQRAINLLGDRRSAERASIAVWLPETDNSWGLAAFGIYGPVRLLRKTNKKSESG